MNIYEKVSSKKSVQKADNFSLAILAGGQNSRIKLEKALLEVSGQSILSREIEILKQVSSRITLITSKQEIKKRFPDIQSIPDIYKKGGPLTGIHAALKYYNTPVFILGGDMPFLSCELIRCQINDFTASGCDILIPRHNVGIEPLHAIYTPDCIPVIEEQLVNGIYPIRAFFNKVDVKYFDVREEFTKSFFNVNTPDDWEKLIKTSI